MQKTVRRTLAFLLVWSVFLTSIPMTAKAEEMEQGEFYSEEAIMPEEMANALETESANDVEVISEIVEKRESNMKYFRMSDGSITAAVYQYDVHYDENGKWVDIDNTFESDTDESEEVYQNIKNEARVKFMKKSNKNKLYTITKGDYRIKVSIEGVSKVVGVVPKIVDEETKNEPYRLEGINSQITYPDILENTDIEYYLVSKELKENIILKKPVAFQSLTYHYDFGNQLVAVQEDEKTILVKEKNGEKVVFTLSAPAMWDAAGNSYDDLKLTLKEFQNGKATIELSWNGEEIKDAIYPVVIDPVNSFSVIGNEINDTHILAGYPNKAYNAENHIRVRNNGYALIQFPTPTLHSGDRIIHAELQLFPYGYFDNSLSIYTNENNFNPPLFINVHRILRSWSGTNATYNNVNPDNNFYDSTVESYRIVDGDDHFYKWDITRLANEWVEGHAENYGVLLKYNQPPANGTMFDSFFCSTNGTYIPKSAWPQIIYQYINTTGLEDYLAYHSQDLGRAGTGYVNDLTGNLTIATPLVSVGGSLMPISASLVYNSNHVNQTDSPYGPGWQLNWSQKIDRTIEEKFGYTIARYTDGDGTEHYFKHDAEASVFLDEKDSTRRIIWLDNNNYVLKDDQDNRHFFVRVNEEKIWYLWKYQDAYGNKIEIDLNETNPNRIDKVTSSTGNEIQFTYNEDGRLLGVKYFDGETPKTIQLEYNTYVNQANNCIGKVIFPDNTYIQYHYSQESGKTHYVSKVVGIDGTSIGYGYTPSAPYRVNDIREYSAQGEQGNHVTISYHASGTVFTDESNDREYLHTFAANGTKKSVVDITAGDQNGYGQYYEYNGGNAAKLEGMGNLTFVSKVQKSTVNLLRNHSFEGTAKLPSVQAWGETTGTSTGGRTTAKHHIGEYSYKLTRPANSNSRRTLGYTRTDVVAGKTYTLSGYVNTAEMVSAGKGASLYVAGTNWQYESEYATESYNGWQRISVTFTAPQTETVSICVCMVGATGSVYFDNLQLEEGGISNYNILENAGFEEDNISGVMPWTSNKTIEFVTEDKIAGNRSARCVGTPTYSKHYCQEIYTTGQKGDTYVASAFAKAEAARCEGYMFTILIRFYNGTTKAGESTFLFNMNTTEWQKLAAAVKAPGAYTKIEFWLLYYTNANTVYFDNAQFVKDTFGSTYTYDENGNLISTVDLQGKEDYTFQYNGNNQLIKETSVSGSEINYTYTDKKSLETVSSGGVKTEYTYDEKGNVTKADSYDEEGQTLHMSSTATYSENGDFMTQVTDVRGNSTSYEYHEQRGYLKSATNAKNVKTEYQYDNSELLQKIRVPLSENTAAEVWYQYTDSKKLASILSPSGTTYSFTYDSFGRNDSIKVGSRTLSGYTYDALGVLQSMTYGNGTTLSYTYDEQNRQKEVLINNVLRYQNYYDGDSRIAMVRDALTGTRQKYEYDLIGRLTVERHTKEFQDVDNHSELMYAELRVRYDDSKNRVAGYDTQIEGYESSTDYVYGELTKAPDIITGVKRNGNRTLSYGYDVLNRLQRRTVQTTTPFVTEYEYLEGEESGTTTSLVKTVRKGNDTYDYSYDALGNIQEIKKNDSLVERYTYDALNQLTKVEGPEVTYEYTYDNGGNLLSVKEIGEKTNVIKTYTYGDSEWKDLLTAYNNQTITYDAIGNPLTYIDGRTFTWTDGRKLATITQGEDSISYTYDVNGLRSSKTVNDNTTTYYWLNGSLQGQKTGEEYIQFLHDESGIIYGFTIKNGTNETTYYYDFNLQGDVVAILDAEGTKVVEYSYDVWGKPLSVTGTLADTIGQKNPIRYRGYYYDEETGFYYVSSRYYDPEIGRFINADNQLSTGSDLTGLNLFAYCGNNPVNRIDPTGEAWWHWAIGAAVVAACAVATVVTCGGFAAAVGAVAAVGSGVAAATTASTIAAGALIGSATAYGIAVVSAASTSSSIKEFNDKGNWGTVLTTTLGGLVGGYDGYTMSKAQTPTSTPTNTSRGSTGRTEPANLREQLAMEQVKSNPSAGTQLTRITLTDPRWPSSEGWVKMQQIVPTSQGNINIHYVYNQTLKIFDDFKFKP